MPCESYKDALIQATASGSELQSDVREHLDACASCRITYAEEQYLFASIDTGLHKLACTEVPAWLLPRVRARLDEEAIFQRSWLVNWRALAGATAIVAVFFAAHLVWRTGMKAQPAETAIRTNAPASVISQPQQQKSLAVAPSRRNSISQSRAAIAKNLVPQEALATRNTQPQVLVPPDQEIVLARYAEQWRQRKRAPLLAENPEDPSVAPLQVAPIQIAQLDVKLLAEEKSQ